MVCITSKTKTKLTHVLMSETSLSNNGLRVFCPADCLRIWITGSKVLAGLPIAAGWRDRH